MNQDFAAWVGQGAVADRTRELIGPSDRGIVLLRRQLVADIDAVARGEDPKGVVRCDDEDRLIELPLVRGETYREPRPRAAYDAMQKALAAMGFPAGYIFQAGQPEWVRAAYDSAIAPR
jgi:5,5'-dehydrodivanillate O-demethylase